MQVAEGGLRTKGFGVFELDLKSAELRKHGIRIKLQEQPFQILAYLLEHPGDVVTREELREKLWSAHTYVDFDRSLNKAMTKLRSALGDSAESPRYIETVPRHGYRFLAEVRIPHGAVVTTLAPKGNGTRGADASGGGIPRLPVEMASGWRGNLRAASASLPPSLSPARQKSTSAGHSWRAALFLIRTARRAEIMVRISVSRRANYAR